MTPLVRAIDAASAADYGCAVADCQHEPSYRVATPLGELDYCDGHADEALASLPDEWLRQWERPPRPDLESEDGIPF